VIQHTTTIGSSSPIEIAVSDDDGPIDLTGATAIELRLQRAADRAVIVVDLAGSVSDAAAGEITHTWADEVTEPGVYAAQLRIVLAGGAVVHVPDERIGGQIGWRFEFLPAVGA
jgi:hypothetical protein